MKLNRYTPIKCYKTNKPIKLGDFVEDLPIQEKERLKSEHNIKVVTFEFICKIKELWVLLSPNSKRSPIIKVSVCKIENLIKI